MLQMEVEALVGARGVCAIYLDFGPVRDTADVTYTSSFFRVFQLAFAKVFPLGLSYTLKYR